MKRFWQGEHHDVEGELRRYRPEPSPAFLAALTKDLDERIRRPRTARRAALVTALTAGMLGAFAVFGGIGYASSAAHSAFHASKLERLVGVSHSSHSTKATPQSSSAKSGATSSHSAKGGTIKLAQTQADQAQGDNPIFGDQYRPGKGCGDKNHIHFRENECKKPPK